MMWQYFDDPMGWFGFGFGFVFMLLFWGLVIWGIVALARWAARQNGGKQEKNLPAGRQAPLDILKERYAKGEVDKKEFEEKKKDLI